VHREEGHRVTARLAHLLTPHLFAEARVVSGAVYGTLTVVAVIAGASHNETSAARVLGFATVSSVGIWAVHVYADVLTSAGVHALPVGAALRRGLKSETGVLLGAVLPLLLLLLGALGVVEDERAIWAAIWSGVILLALNPLVWLRRQGNAWGKSLAAAAVGGVIGLVLVLLKVLLH
jgi:hypothetical protein